jgi:hypothetical protein
MVISTIHDSHANTLILQQIKRAHSHLVNIMSARSLEDAEHLYELGANYVLVPHVISGKHTALMIQEYEFDIEKYAKHKMEDFMLMK